MTTESKQAEEIQTEKAKMPHSGQAEGIRTLREYMVPVIAGVVIALVVVIGFGIYKSNQAAEVQQAAIAMMQAQSIEDIQRVAADFPDTPTGPSAQLALANTYLQNGQPLMAKSSYEKFIKTYPKHPLTPAAQLGIAYAIEAEGNLDAALKAFQSFEENHPDYFMTPQAIFSQGRCLEQMGQFADAKAIYEDFIVSYPDSRWTDHARTAVLYAEKGRRAREKGLDIVQQQQPMVEVPFAPVAPFVPQDQPPLNIESPVESVNLAEPVESTAPATETTAPAIETDDAEAVQEPAGEELSEAEKVILEEPVAEEPVVEESVVEEPVSEESDVEESDIEEPAIEEPVVEEFGGEEPAAEALAVGELTAEKNAVPPEAAPSTDTEAAE
jgi:TolA-binding protein